MNLLMLTTDYPLKGDSIYTDLAKALLKESHKVTVIVNEESKNIDKTNIFLESGVEVLRVKVGNIYNNSLFEKALSFLKSNGRIKKAVKQHLANRQYDYIIFMSQPVTISKTIKWLMNRFSCPSYLMMKDIFPQNAVDLGMFSKLSPVYWYFRYKEIELYKVATTIGCMSEQNIKYLVEHNKYLEKNKFELFPNTKKKVVEDAELENKETFNYKEKFGIPKDSIVAVYGGNMGKPQGIDFFIEVLEEYKNNKKVSFLIIARGTEKDKVYNYVKDNNIENVYTFDLMPREDYEKIILECDIGLIFLDPKFTIPNFPSKSLSYLEYGIPIMFAGDINNDFKDMLIETKSGLWCKSGNMDEFKCNFDKLCNDDEYRRCLSRNARQCFVDRYCVEKSIAILNKRLTKDVY